MDRQRQLNGEFVWRKRMNDIKKIKFRLIDEGYVEIVATFEGALEDKEVVIGSIFSESGDLKSCSGKNSIQICGFDNMQGLWSCGRYNHSQDCCLVWNNIEKWLETKITARTEKLEEKKQ